MNYLNRIICGDCLKVLPTIKERSVNLVFGSPPYEDARTLGINWTLKGQAWVDWMVKVTKECLRVCDGLVAFVVEGRTKNYRWSAVPALLMADLHRAGVHLRNPPIFNRIGIPGSGGPDWLRNDYEFILCATNRGKLPWSNNKACGHTPKWAPGGEMSNRLSDGSRVNQWGHSINSGATYVDVKGKIRSKGKRPSHKLHTKRKKNGKTEKQTYYPPTKANPGNIIRCNVGGGLMGHPLAHENEAPFPEELAKFFILSFCAPGAVVLDPFVGSGTTAAVAYKYGRKFIGIDIRQSQVDLANRRLSLEKE